LNENEKKQITYKCSSARRYKCSDDTFLLEHARAPKPILNPIKASREKHISIIFSLFFMKKWIF